MKPILTLAASLGLWVAGAAHAQTPSAPASEPNAAQQIPVEMYEAPHARHLTAPNCDSHVGFSESDACEALLAGPRDLLLRARLAERRAHRIRHVDEVQLEQLRTDDTPYAIAGRMRDDGSWYLHLFKRHFRVEIDAGYVTQVKLRCQKKYLGFALDPKLQYQVNGKDGDCWMELDGSPAASFKLVQF